MVPNSKKNFYHLPDICEAELSGMIALQAHAVAKVRELHSLPQKDPEYIEFNIDTFSGKIIFVFAGGTGCIGRMDQDLTA